MNSESNESRPKVSVIGMGYVGLCLSAGLSKFGTTVYCVDIDEDVIAQLKKGQCPIHEPLLPELIKKGIESKKLHPTLDLMEAIMNTDVSFICVGTPCDDDGYIDLSYIKQVSIEIGEILKSKQDYHVISIKSTVIPGTTDSHMIPLIEENSGKKVGIDFGACMTPEFLKEGDAINDFMNPDKIVIGAYDEKSKNVMSSVWIDFHIDRIGKNYFLFCDLRTAEMIKYANNSFLATKISFINEIANLAEIFGVDVKIVSEAIGMDKRISSHFLNAGLGFGGSCFPKDVKALYSAGKSAGYNPVLLDSVLEVNKDQPLRPIEILKNTIGEISGKTIAVLGLSFKPNTDDVRFAPSIKLVNKLLKDGSRVKVYDPVAIENFKLYFQDFQEKNRSQITYSKSPKDAIANCSAVLIATEWDEFKTLIPEDFEKQMQNPVIVDGRRIYDPSIFEGTKVVYKAIGFSNSKEFKPK